MKTSVDIVPRWIRILVGTIALMNIVYGIAGYFDMSLLFRDAASIDLTNFLIKNASYEFAARNLAIGLALGIVAVRGVPESIAIVTIIRALVEIQTVIIVMVEGIVTAKILMPIAFLAIEILIIKTMVDVIGKRNLQQ